MNNYLNFYQLIVFLPLYIVGLFIDRFSKKEIVFGVTFTRKLLKDSFIRNVRKKYLIIYNVLALAVFVSTSIIIFDSNKEGFIMFAVLLWMVIIGVLVASANKQLLIYKKSLLKKMNVKNKKEDYNKVVIVNTERRKVPNKILFIIPLVILLISVIMTILMYSNIPDKIPMHFDFYGNITSYADKNLISAFSMVFAQGFIIALIYLVNIITYKSKLILNPNKPKVSEEQLKLARYRMSLLMIGLATDLSFLFLYVQLKIVGFINFSFITDIIVFTASILIIFIGLFLYYVTTGDYGDKIKMDANIEYDEQLIDNDDELWLFGMFYNNPNDPSLNVPKRLGGGYTINIGHPLGKVIFVVLLLFILVVLVISMFSI